MAGLAGTASAFMCPHHLPGQAGLLARAPTTLSRAAAAASPRQRGRALARLRASQAGSISEGTGGTRAETSAVSVIKTRMLQLSTEYGDPAINVPTHVQRALNDLAKQLEAEQGISEAGTCTSFVRRHLPPVEPSCLR
jgi:hypothetical protein